MRASTLSLLLILTACSGSQLAPQPSPEPNAPIESTEPLVADWPNESWSEAAYKAALELGGDRLLDVLAPDLITVCPNFPSMEKNDRAKVYVFLVSAMARYESSFKPSTTYTENFDDAKGKPVISAGLLQISLESGRSYGCPITKTEDLFSPTVNINCGFRILTRWIPNDGLAFTNKKGCGRYWSVCRETSKSRPKILAKLKQLPVCGNP